MRPMLMFGAGTLLLVLAALPALAGPGRIVALGGGITATLDALGLADALVAIDASSHPPASRPDLPRVGYYRQLSAEGVLALRPDQIIGPVGAGPDAAIDQLKASGARIELLPAVTSVAGARERIDAIGRAVGRPEEAAALIAAFDADLAKARTIAERGPKPRVLFVFVHGGASLQVAGRGTAADAMIQAAGGANVGEHQGYRPLTAEGVVVARPDVILTTPRALAGAGGEAALWKNPGVAATPAGQQKRLIVIDDVRLLGFGPETGAVVRELAEALHR